MPPSNIFVVALTASVLVLLAPWAKSQGLVTTVVGNGSAGAADGTAATFRNIASIALGPGEAFALLVDSDNAVVRRVELPSGVTSTIAGAAGVIGGADGQGSAASFTGPHPIAMNALGTFALVVSCLDLHKISVYAH